MSFIDLVTIKIIIRITTVHTVRISVQSKNNMYNCLPKDKFLAINELCNKSLSYSFFCIRWEVMGIEGRRPTRRSSPSLDFRGGASAFLYGDGIGASRRHENFREKMSF